MLHPRTARDARRRLPAPRAVRLAPNAVADTGEIEGYGCVFGFCDTYGTIFEPGAFASSVARHASGERRVKMLWQHEQEEPIGVWDTLAEDDYGLRVSGRLLLEVARARECHALMKAGAIDGLSVGFDTLRSRFVHPDELPAQATPYQTGPNGLVEIYEDVDLWEVSCVTFPAVEPSVVDTVRHSPARPGVATSLDLTPLAAALARRQLALSRLLSRH